jgi:glycosyltransferase involved in cell wall biosynthesis
LFFFSSDERRQARGALGIRDNEVLVLTITRVVPHKRLERIIDAVGLLQQQGLPAWYSLVGGLGDTYERELRQRMARQPIPERFVLLPFSSAEQLRCLAAAADIGVWMQIAISLTEAMGTGLPILLPWRLSLSHLVQHGENGWYWDEPHGFEAALAEAVAFLQSMEEQHRCQWRQAVAQHNAERFAYEAILSRVFKQLGFSIP